jgi:hypothetical protein
MPDAEDRRDAILLQQRGGNATNPQSQSFDDDDLLFAMSDMHISGT